jgi:alkylation response protein AidB-like acyl-CoA dehydrogenase
MVAVNERVDAAAVAAALRDDAAARDRAGAAPAGEIALLRESGLLRVPMEAGWPAAYAAAGTVAAADASVGHLLAYHYLHLWRAALFGDAGTLHAETAARGWFWAAVSNPREDALTVTPDGGELVITGRKAFATGAEVADRLLVSGRRTDTGRKVTAVVDARAPGVRHLRDWDNIGQRLSASGGVVFDGVRVPAGAVLGEEPADGDPAAPRLSLSSLGFQLALAHLCVATAEGAIEAAAGYSRGPARPWPASGVARAVDDPYLLAGYGQLVASTRAARALTDRAAAALLRATEAGTALTAAGRGEVALEVSAARVVSGRVALDTTAGVLDQVGARATAARHAMDRFWRNARTLTLHDPAAYKARELGAALLTGEVPAWTGYS